MAQHKVTILEFPKTRVCRDCGERKLLDEKHFHKQRPPRIAKRMPDYRWDCNVCHAKKCRKRLLATTTIVERRTYIRNYMRSYNRYQVRA